MSYLVYLNHYDIRQKPAQYLSVLYEVLAHNLDAHFILNEDYIKKYEIGDRWEVRWVRNHWKSYDEVYSRLKAENCTVLEKPEVIAEAMNLGYMAPSELLSWAANEEYIPAEAGAIENILKKKHIKAGVTWMNNKCFKNVLNRFNIPTIHHEMGPFRPVTYIPTIYFDYSGVNGNTEFDARFEEFLKITDSVPILSRKELIRILSPNYYRELNKVVDNVDTDYVIGVGLQVEMDTNLLLFNEGRHWVDPILAALRDTWGDILVRPHPSAGYSLKPTEQRMIIDDVSKSKAHEFIGKCNKIYCLNSSVGLEAMLLGREARIFGDSPFKNICTMDPETQLKALNFVVFGYLIHRDLLFDEAYYEFRLGTRDEKEIYLDNMKRLLKKAKV